TAANYSEIIIVITGEATAALALQLQLNGVSGTAYVYNGQRTTNAALTSVSATGQAQFVPLSATAISAANDTFFAEIHIPLSDTTGAKLSGFSFAADGITNSYMEDFTFQVNGGPTITSITTKTSTSTWKANTRITTIG